MKSVDSKERTGFPLFGVLAMLLFFTGTAIKYLPTETSRPKPADMRPVSCESAQDVDARMWHDPFTITKRHADDRKPEDATEGDKRTFKRLQGEIGASLDAGNVTILAVMTLPGLHSENAEHLRRMRFAVLAGLSKTGYVPNDECHLGYVHDFISSSVSPSARSHSPPLEKPDTLMRTLHLPSSSPNAVPPFAFTSSTAPSTCSVERSAMVAQLIPYEWYRGSKEALLDGGGQQQKTPKAAVLVLWLSEEILSEQPLIKLHAILRKLWPAVVDGGNAVKKPRFVVLGPASAGMLDKMVQPQPGFFHTGMGSHQREAEDPCTLARHWFEKRGVEFISPLVGIDAPSTACPKDADDSRDLGGWFRSRLLVIVHSPLRLCEALLDELNLRFAAPGGNDPKVTNRIVLIADWDTMAGRRLPQAFVDAMGKKYLPADLALHVGYLRGLSGDAEAVKTADKDGAKDASKTTGLFQSVTSGVPAEGTSQRDYVKRLAAALDKDIDSIEQLKGGVKQKVKAIGLLGSDVQDKLLLLEELRPRFQDLVFFTTDLDARHLDAGVKRWTRNLVVVSSFGLRLIDDHGDVSQGSVPPFRDSQQTAIFTATQLALTNQASQAKDTGGQYLRDTPPRVFEIGRTEAVDLSPQVTPTPRKIHPVPFGFQLGWYHAKLFKFISIFLLACWFMVVAFSPRYKSFLLENWRWITGLIAGTFVLVIGVLFWFAQHYQAESFQGEPLLWFEGISVWPSECLRLLAIIFSMWSIYLVHQSVRWDIDKLADDFALNAEAIHPKPAQANKGVVGRAIDIMWDILFPFRFGDSDQAEVIAQKLFCSYVSANKWNARIVRLVVITTIYLVFGGVIFSMFEAPLRPFRGNLSKEIDLIMVILSVVASTLLLLFIADISRVSSAMLWKLRIGATQWPEKLYRNKREKLRAVFRVEGDPGATLNERPQSKEEAGPTESKKEEHEEVINDFIDFEFVADHTERICKLIWYPVIPLLLMFLARTNIFDNWLFWPPLVIVLCMSILIMVGSAYALQKSAEELRDSAIEKLSEKLVYAKGRPELGHSAAQIEALLQWIRSVKKGAFLPFFERPLVHSILVSLSSLGGISILEYFSFCS
ncbi:MAG TPA: hypothetical protein DCZ69_06310 [Syntrophobacteraceae bacterium]|nr:hypothetical protein [Syntrophobacteraceae bacterium]